MRCFEAGCRNGPDWVVEDVITGEFGAACNKHVALCLTGRVHIVTNVKEDGPIMRGYKEKLNELDSTYAGRNP